MHFMSIKISSHLPLCTSESSVLVCEKVPGRVLTHSKTVAARCLTCSCLCCFPKGPEGQGEEEEFPEGAGF